MCEEERLLNKDIMKMVEERAAYSQLTTEEIGAIVDETRRRLEQTKEKFLTHVELQQLKGQIPKPVDAETQRIVEMVGTHTLSDECMNKVCCIV